jgi:iron(III) transport system ATP-binding protein
MTSRYLDSILRVSHVSKRFGETVAVDDVSLDVGPTEIVALVGPSGSGKSTVLRMIAGLYSIDRGSIEIGGRVVDDAATSLPPERRRVGLVFQEHALFPHLTVARNVAFGIRGAADEAAVVEEMLRLVGLESHAERYPHELSGGERQRVALARSLAPQPDLLLLDEPFANLDPNLRARLRDDVMTVLAETASPAVFVTHDQREALAIGDRVAVIDGGHLAQIGTPTTVFHSPESRFVGQFMGEADFLDPADLDSIGLVAAGNGTGSSMVRPDDVVVEPDADGVGTIVRGEFRGTTWCYTVALPTGSTVRSTADYHQLFEHGDRVRVTLRPGARAVVVRS